MDRKKFIRVLASVPLLGIPFRTISSRPTPEECRTERDVEGPFYKANAPLRAVLDTVGEPLIITGTVRRADDCESPLSHATIDVWHCDQDGHYDMRGFKGRGRVLTDENGDYTFTTIFPPPYGSRPRHIHVKARAAGRPELTTQIYFQGDPDIQNDFARHAGKKRVIELKTAAKVKTGVFDIYL